MSKKTVLATLKKNRYLIISCAVLIAGIVFGTAVLKYLPNELCRSIYEITSKESENFYIGFIDKFTLPFIIITALYLSGFSAAGQVTAGIAVFSDGAIYGLKNAVNFSFGGTDFFVSALLEYFTFTVFIGFLLLIMSENAFASARKICVSLKSDAVEKPCYNAKNLTVKYIAFTAVFAVFSVFSVFASSFF